MCVKSSKLFFHELLSRIYMSLEKKIVVNCQVSLEKKKQNLTISTNFCSLAFKYVHYISRLILFQTQIRIN